MRKELREATDQYDLISQMGVHPICKTDSKIIDTLTSIVIDMGANSKLIEALKAWKKESDEDILYRLEELGLDVEQDVGGALKNTIDYVDYEGNTLALKSLFSVKMVDGYDTVGCMPVYKVLINETENPNVINGNIEVSFDDEIDRELSIQDFKEKLSEFANIRFL